MMYSTVRHKMKLATTVVTARLLSGESCLVHSLYAALSTPRKWSETSHKIDKFELCNKLSEVGSTGHNLTDFLHHLTNNGIKLDEVDLLFCVQKLRKYGRYKHCAEILEWMEKASVCFRYHGLRLTITYKLKGIGEAEKYFMNLPLLAKKPYLFGALLNCYCSEKMLVKALAVFKKMEKMDCVSKSLIFNNLMALYIQIDQPEEVPRLVEEMKQQNIPLSSLSYLIWLQSYGYLKDLAGVEQVMDEIEGCSVLKNDWRFYSSLFSAYIKVGGQSEKAALALKKLEEVLDHPNLLDRDGYHHLISLHAGTGNEESLFRTWGKLKSKYIECHNRSYIIMLQALSELDNSIEALRKVLEEWECRHSKYDVRLPSIAIAAYLRHGMLEEAEMLFKDTMSRKAGQNLSSAHVSFMYYYLGKQQTDSALLHMEAAHSDGWKPNAEKLGPFFEYFKQEKDFHGAEKLCNMLKDDYALDSRAYLWLLQTYAAAGKESPRMRQRMEKDGIDISSEHEEFLCKICLN